MKTHQALICIAALAAAAQLDADNSLLVSATSLSFTVNGGPPAPQGLNVFSQTGTLTVTAAVSTTTGGTWLIVTPASATTPVTLVVSVDASGLAPGTYTGAVSLTAAGASNSPFTVAVTLTVNASVLLAVSPASISFTYQTGGVSPAAQALNVTSNGAALGFTTSLTTNGGGSWVQADPLSGTTPGAINISVNPAGLAPGTYTGAVSVASLGAANSPVIVPVSVTVTGEAQLTISPSSLNFYYETGEAPPAMQPVSLGSTGAPINFTAAVATSSGGNWLVSSPEQGATPGMIDIGVSASALQAGTYTGTVTISGGSAAPQTVPVTLVVSSSPLLIASPAALTFNYQTAGLQPPSQAVTLASTGSALAYTVAVSTVAGGAWLLVDNASGNTPGTLTIGANAAALQPGTYSGAVTITAAGAGNSPVTIPVTLTISNSVLASVFPGTLSFNFQTGGTNPPVQTASVTSAGAPLNFTAAAATSAGGNWLSVTPTTGITPGTFNVAVNPSGLATGSYSGTITVTAPGAANSPIAIPIHLTVSASPLLIASPGAIEIGTTLGGPGLGVQSVSLTSTSAASPLDFTVAYGTNNGGNWLLAGPLSATTPANLSVAINATGLGAGTYTGSIVIKSPASANSPLTIPVTLIVAPSASLSASPASLTFNQAQGTNPPSGQTIAVSSSSGALNFSAVATTSDGGAWLTASSNTLATPGTVTVSVNGSLLSPGTYNGSITVISAGAFNSPLTIPVTLVIAAAPPVSLNVTALSFSYEVGAAAPAAQAIEITSAAGPATFGVTAAAAAGGAWLTATPASGTTPASVNVSVDPVGLAPGTYTGTVSIGSPTASDNVQTVTVTLTVTAQAAPVIAGVDNAASLVSGTVSPGLLVAIFGTNIGPATAVSGTVSNGALTTTLGGTQVFFDGIPAPLIYVSSGQVNAVVPYEIPGRFSTNLQISFGGALSNILQLTVQDTAPGIFTLAANGAGQGAILNQDLTVNGTANPAAKGSIIVIYATGEGRTNPEAVTGLLTTNASTLPVASVSVTIGGIPASSVEYAGEAPGLVAGVLQVNAVVPASVPSGPAAVVLTIGGVSSQTGVTVAMQ